MKHRLPLAPDSLTLLPSHCPLLCRLLSVLSPKCSGVNSSAVFSFHIHPLEISPNSMAGKTFSFLTSRADLFPELGTCVFSSLLETLCGRELVLTRADVLASTPTTTSHQPASPSASSDLGVSIHWVSRAIPQVHPSSFLPHVIREPTSSSSRIARIPPLLIHPLAARLEDISLLFPGQLQYVVECSPWSSLGHLPPLLLSRRERGKAGIGHSVPLLRKAPRKMNVFLQN